MADFIGSPSKKVIQGTLRAGGGTPFVEVDGGQRLAVPSMLSGQAGQRVVFGIRPEHAAMSAGTGGVTLEVEVVEPTGANTQLFTHLGGAHLCAISTERREFRPGDRITLDFPDDRIHLFDAETGQRL